MEYPSKAKWSTCDQSDNDDQVSVGYDTGCEFCPNDIELGLGDGNSVVSINYKDAEWVAARLLDAARAIRLRK